MGSPTTKIASILLRETDPTPEEWETLTDLQRNRLGPLLGKFTLTTLGQVLGIRSPEAVGSLYKIQGYFKAKLVNREARWGKGALITKQIWGLTRDGGLWIVGTIVFDEDTGGTLGESEIHQVSTAEALREFGPAAVWDLFQEIFDLCREHLDNRQSALAMAEAEFQPLRAVVQQKLHPQQTWL